MTSAEYILEQLESGRLDGRHYEGQTEHKAPGPGKDYVTYSYRVEGGTVYDIRTHRIKTFSSEGTEWTSEDNEMPLTGMEAVDFINRHPYTFSDVIQESQNQ